MDIPAELLRDHLTETANYNDGLCAFDPYAGNILGSVVASDANNRQHAYIAFPVGEVKSDLSQCSFLFMFHLFKCFFRFVSFTLSSRGSTYLQAFREFC